VNQLGVSQLLVDVAPHLVVQVEGKKGGGGEEEKRARRNKPA